MKLYDLAVKTSISFLKKTSKTVWVLSTYCSIYKSSVNALYDGPQTTIENLAIFYLLIGKTWKLHYHENLFNKIAINWNFDILHSNQDHIISKIVLSKTVLTEDLFYVLNNFIQLRQMESCSFTKNKQMTTPSPYILIVFL